MIEPVKLVICDIDWTLLSRERRVLSPYSIEIFEKMHQKGIYFGLASGRPLDEVLKAYESWGLSFPCDVIISMNGGELWNHHTQEFHEFYKLKKEWIREIVEITEPLNVNPYMYYHGGLKAMKYTDEMNECAIRNQKPLIVAKDIDDFADEENGKIMIRIKASEMEEFEKYIREHSSGKYQEFKTQRTLMEFADKRISKGNALIEYCTMNHMPLEQVVAFGDTTNDNDMIKAAGWGVCVLGGSIDTMAISDDVTDLDPDHDGVAHYVEKNILNVQEYLL
ncbi:MAG: HAD-IIB family hydrolase [Erysipelotrichaceae bacterium]|nr:HAD-IIB family hydrolase [Erysipelotrichaceae bacterium]